MPTAENAKLDYEGGQTAVAMAVLTNSGDNMEFNTGSTIQWSRRSGYTPVVRPNGLLTGGAIIPAVSATSDYVDTAALTCNLNGVVTSVSADTDVDCPRAATDVSKICSITVNSSGAIAVVEGADGSDSSLSETRAAAGGPPLIPTDSIEIGQVRYTGNTSAAVATTEIFTTVGLHRERADFPQYTINYATGAVTFISALSTIHTGAVPKAVEASYYTPIYAEVPLASDFVPPETTHSLSSTQVYNTTIASSSSTLNQGSFTAYNQNNIDDAIVTLKNEFLWFRFYWDRYESQYILVQGKLGISRTFPADSELQAACTISAETEGTEYSS